MFYISCPQMVFEPHFQGVLMTLGNEIVSLEFVIQKDYFSFRNKMWVFLLTFPECWCYLIKSTNKNLKYSHMKRCLSKTSEKFRENISTDKNETSEMVVISLVPSFWLAKKQYSLFSNYLHVKSIFYCKKKVSRVRGEQNSPTKKDEKANHKNCSLAWGCFISPVGSWNESSLRWRRLDIKI